MKQVFFLKTPDLIVLKKLLTFTTIIFVSHDFYLVVLSDLNKILATIIYFYYSYVLFIRTPFCPIDPSAKYATIAIMFQ